MKSPKGWENLFLSIYMDESTNNAYATFQKLPNEYMLISDIAETYETITNKIPSVKMEINTFYFLFLIRSHAAFLASSRIAISSHISEAYVLMRGCLEYSLYGHYFFQYPEKAKIWISRHDSEDAYKKAKQECKITLMLKELKKKNEGIGKKADFLYNKSIDQGAHPNIKALQEELKIENIDDGKAMKIELNFVSNDIDQIRSCLKTNSLVGLCALDIFQSIYKEHFDKSGASKIMDGLKERHTRIYLK